LTIGGSFTAEATYAQGSKPNVVILATGGTVARVRAGSTESETYKASKVSIDDLVGGLP